MAGSLEVNNEYGNKVGSMSASFEQKHTGEMSLCFMTEQVNLDG